MFYDILLRICLMKWFTLMCLQNRVWAEGEVSKVPRAQLLSRHLLSLLCRSQYLLKFCALDACLPHSSPSLAPESI